MSIAHTTGHGIAVPTHIPSDTCIRCDEPPTGARGLCPYHYNKWRKHQVHNGTFIPRYIPSADTKEHLALLRAAGVGLPRISELSGVYLRTLQELFSDNRSGTMDRRVAAAIWSVDLPTTPYDPVYAAGAYTSVVGVSRRLQALARIGHNRVTIAGDLGYGPRSNALGRLYAPKPGAVMTIDLARRLVAIYDRRRHRRGPSTRTIGHAKRAGWVEPAAWTAATIDDPAASPDTNARRMAQRRIVERERYEALVSDRVADLRAVGRITTPAQEAAALGITLDALQQRARRAETDDNEEMAS